MATHSSILAWKIPWTEEPSRLHSPWGHKESDTTEQLTHKHTHTHIYTMEYYSTIKRNNIGSFVETWMDIESVIHSELSQRKT